MTPRRSSERSRTITISSSRQTRDAKRGGRGSGGRENRKVKKKPEKVAKAPRARSGGNRRRSSSRSFSLPRLPRIPLPSFGIISLLIKLALVGAIGYAVVYGADAAWRAVTSSAELSELSDKLIKRLLDEDVPRAAEPAPKVKAEKNAQPSEALPAPKGATATGGDASAKASKRAELEAGAPEDYAGESERSSKKSAAELDSIVDRVVGGR